MRMRLMFALACVAGCLALTRSDAQPPPVFVNTVAITSHVANGTYKGGGGLVIVFDFENFSANAETVTLKITDVSGAPPFPAPYQDTIQVPANTQTNCAFANCGALPAGTYTIWVGISEGNTPVAYSHSITVTIT